MKTTQSTGTHPDHQTVARTFEFKTNGKAIAIGFTEQHLSPHAGSATFWGWVHRLDWRQTLAAALPHPLPASNNKLLPLEKALAFMHGLLCDARKLTHVAYLRRDPLAGELLGTRRAAHRDCLPLKTTTNQSLFRLWIFSLCRACVLLRLCYWFS